MKIVGEPLNKWNSWNNNYIFLYFLVGFLDKKDEKWGGGRGNKNIWEREKLETSLRNKHFCIQSVKII